MPHDHESSPLPNHRPTDKNQGTPTSEPQSWIVRILQRPLNIVHVLLFVGALYALDSLRSPRDQRPSLSNFKNPTTSGRFDPRSPQFDPELFRRWQQHHATSQYWKVAVADLHPYRFGYVEDPHEPASQFYRRMIRNLEAKVQAARSQSTDDVDEDLVEMAERHLAQDEDALRLLKRVHELAEQRGVLDETTSVEQQVAAAEQVATALTDDPGLLDQVEDPESRALLEALYDMDVMRLEQLREIELMQARLQERHPLTSFALPDPPE